MGLGDEEICEVRSNIMNGGNSLDIDLFKNYVQIKAYLLNLLTPMNKLG